MVVVVMVVVLVVSSVVVVVLAIGILKERVDGNSLFSMRRTAESRGSRMFHFFT